MATAVMDRVTQMFPELTPAQIERIAGIGRRREVRAGEVLTEVGEPGPGRAKPFWPVNLFMFLGELGLVLWITSVVGLRAASRAFDEARARWGEAHHAAIGYGQSRLLLAARQQGRFAELLQTLEAIPIQQNVSHCMLVLERFQAEGNNLPRAFLSAGKT